MEALGWERRLGPALLVVLLALGALGAAWGGGRGTAAARRVALALTGHHHLGEGSWPINLTGPYEWLHIPKAGTSWGNVLVLWACPELEARIWVAKGGAPGLPEPCRERFRPPGGWPWGSFGSHYTLVNRTDDQLRKVFALVRNPRTRFASAFHYFHEYTRPEASEGEICQEVTEVYPQERGFSTRGAQAKMIVGVPADMALPKRFLEPVEPTPELVEEACRRLRLFAFVGISDHWRASVCLFHAMYGGRQHELEHANVREGNYTGGALREVDCGDTADGRLFECAMEVFNANLKRHPQCAREAAGAGAGGAD